MSANNNVVSFPSNRRRDEEIVELFMKKLELERKFRRGMLNDGEILEQDMLLLNEMFYIAKRFNL